MNFRADRARQLTAAFVAPGFDGFVRARVPALRRFVCLSEYDARLPAAVAFAPENLDNTLGDVIAHAGLSQRSEEHTSELKSLMRSSYAVFCMKKKKNQANIEPTTDKRT